MELIFQQNTRDITYVDVFTSIPNGPDSLWAVVSTDFLWPDPIYEAIKTGEPVKCKLTIVGD